MLFLDGNITRVFEVVCAFVRWEEVEQFTDLAPGRLDFARLGVAQQVLQLGEDLFDGLEVGAVWRQEDEVSAFGADGIAAALPLWLPRLSRWRCRPWPGWGRENLLDIDGEELTIDGTIDHASCADPIVAQRGDEGHRLRLMSQPDF
jgi:hypothetical protein